MHATQTMERRPHSLFFPTLLIGVGLLLLLGNLGVISFDFWWAVFQLWPLLLIAVGADLLFGRRTGWVGMLLAVLLLGVMASVAYGFTGFWRGALAGGDPITVSQPVTGLESAEIKLIAGVTRLTIKDSDSSAQLVEGKVTPLRNERISQNFNKRGDIGIFTLSSQGNSVGPFGFWNAGGEGSWDLYLNRTVPTALRIETGVGFADLDLRNLILTDLQVNTGVGQTKIYLPATSDFKGSIQGGVGQVTVYVPANTPVRIKANAGIGGVSVQGDYDRRGDLYVSSAYEKAEKRIDLEIEGGIGSISVRESE